MPKKSSGVTKRPNGVWRARYIDESGREHARHFKRKVDADNWVIEMKASIIAGRYIDPRAGEITFGQWFGQWSESQVWARGTRLKADQALGSTTFADTPIKRILPSHVQGWIKAISASLAPATVKVRYNLVHGAFLAAVHDKVIASDPCTRVKLPRERRREAAMAIPSPEQVREALEAAEEWFAPYVAVCAFAGLRLGEAAGLQVRDIDFLRRTLRVDRQVQGENRANAEVVPPKDGSERTVYIPDELLKLLARHIETVGVFGEEGWLFSLGGHLLNRNSAGNQWRNVREASGLPEEYTLHDLRHFYASGLIADGCDVVTVQRALGHSSPTITLNTYAHLWPSAEDKTRTAASGLMASVLGSDPDSIRTAAQ